MLILLGIGSLGLLSAAAVALAQQPGGGFPPSAPVPGGKKSGMIYTNKRAFKLPVNLPLEQRAQLRSLCLYVKTRDTEWQKHLSMSPMETEFIYRAAQDGEYWFIVGTEDRNGQTRPAPHEVKMRRRGSRS